MGKYFEDIWLHICAVMGSCARERHCNYIVGNSKFFDVLVPTERVYEDMLLKAGAKTVQVKPIRKRNSKKELLEFDVVAGL